MKPDEDELPDLLKSRFGFVSKDLSVSYCASAEPQQLSIGIAIDTKYINVPHDCLYWLSSVGNGGMIGGAEFAPELGKMRVITDFGKGKARQRSGTIEVVAMSPWFIRNIIQYIVQAAEVLSLSITGSIPAAKGSLSAGTEDVVRWFANRKDAFIGRWPDLGFELKEEPSPGKMSLRVSLREGVKQAHVDTMELLLADWSACLRQYPCRDMTNRGSMQVDSRIARTKKELRIGKTSFDYIPGPASDLLLNGLCAMNARGELPIESVELSV